jgi:O-antigen/teichoic acid export membrane protein
MMAFVAGVDAFCCLPFVFLRYQRRVGRFAFLKLGGIGLTIGLNLFFLVLCPVLWERWGGWMEWFYRPGYGVGYVFVSNVVSTGVVFCLLLPEVVAGFRGRFAWGRLRRMLGYCFPILVLGVAGIFNQTADKILFPFLFEDRGCAEWELGVYGACFKIAVVMVLFIQAFRYAYEPFVLARAGEGDARRLYGEAMKVFVIFSLVILVGVLFCLEDVLIYFVDGRYHAGLGVVPVVMLGELFFGVYFNLSIWYKLTDQTRWGAYFSLVGCGVTVGVIVGFAPRYGFMACAWASFVSNLVMMLLSYFVGRRRFPVAYDLRSALFYSVLAAGCYVVGMAPVFEPVVFRLLYRGVIWGVFVGVIVKRDVPLGGIPFIGRWFGR